MKKFWLLLIVAGLLAWGLYKRHERTVDMQLEQIAAVNPYGFVPVPMPDDAPMNTVLVFAPANCPQQAGQRARRLLTALQAQGVPARLQSSYRLTRMDSMTQQQRALLDAVMTGPLPAVLIGGMGKANPSSTETLNEYQRQHPRS